MISAVVVVAPVPLVTTIDREPAEGVTLFIVRADPVVAPVIESMTLVEAPVIVELVKTNVESAAAAMLIPVKVTEPTLAFTTWGVAPDAVPTGRTSPVPAATAVKLPFVAVIAPKVAVNVVPAVIEVVAFNAPA